LEERRQLLGRIRQDIEAVAAEAIALLERVSSTPHG
jgi:hypothetical protein